MYAAFLSFSVHSIWSFLLCHPVFCENLIFYNVIKTGSGIFIDSNIFVHHFTGVSDECSGFLSRCKRGELTGMTSVNVILEVLHRLMMVEAVRKNLVKLPNVVKKLSGALQRLKRLNEYFINTEKIQDMGIAQLIL